jgi:DNA-binding transcriptional regulator YdaS (Cro superfamily)
MFAEFIITSGETRAAWADRLGISRSYLSDLLNGKKTPSLSLASQIERLTNGMVLASSWMDGGTCTEEDAA